jgi:hypothetical protein
MNYTKRKILVFGGPAMPGFGCGPDQKREHTARSLTNQRMRFLFMMLRISLEGGRDAERS